MHCHIWKVTNFTSSHCKTTSRTFTAEQQDKELSSQEHLTYEAEQQDKNLGIKLTAELPGILNWAIQGCLDWQQQGLNPPQVVLDQVSAYKTEMDSIAQFVEQECSLESDAEYPASKLYEACRHYCQVLGRKPQSNGAFKKALDKLVNVYQSRSSSGIQWHGIQPLM